MILQVIVMFNPPQKKEYIQVTSQTYALNPPMPLMAYLLWCDFPLGVAHWHLEAVGCCKNPWITEDPWGEIRLGLLMAEILHHQG